MFKDIKKKVGYIFDVKQKKQLLFVFSIILLGSILELIGISAVYPFINIALDQNVIFNNKLLSWIFFTFKMKSPIQFQFILALGIVAIYLVKNLYGMYTSFVISGFQFKNQRVLALKMMDTYLKESYTFHLKRNSATLLRNMTSDLGNFFSLVMNCITMLSHITLAIILAIYLCFMDFWLTTVLMIVMVVFILIYTKLIKRKTLEFGKRVQENNGKMTQWLNQAFGGIKEIKILGREQYFIDNYNIYSARSVHINRVFALIGPIPRLTLETVCVGTILLMVVFKLSTSLDAAAYISRLAVFAMALFRLFPRIAETSNCFNNILFLKASMDLVYEDLKEIEIISDRDMMKDTGIDISFEKEVKIKDISYAYPGTERKIFEQVNIEIKRGEAIAFIGSSGAGKTTLADVVLGILLPEHGDIYVDGIPISVNPAAWARKLGYIPQNIFLVDDTIRNNIAFGLNITVEDDERIWKAAEGAQLAEFIRKLTNGLDTMIGERGVRLSGGQRQRIGIARALFNNPDILVLDEATSALDNETEAAVMEAINHLQGSKTMIIIAHRLSTVKNCNSFYKVEDGKVLKIDKLPE